MTAAPLNLVHSSARPASSQRSPPLRQRRSRSLILHEYSGLPSCRLTRLCASHIHTESSSREPTLLRHATRPSKRSRRRQKPKERARGREGVERARERESHTARKMRREAGTSCKWKEIDRAAKTLQGICLTLKPQCGDATRVPRRVFLEPYFEVFSTMAAGIEVYNGTNELVCSG